MSSGARAILSTPGGSCRTVISTAQSIQICAVHVSQFYIPWWGGGGYFCIDDAEDLNVWPKIRKIPARAKHIKTRTLKKMANTDLTGGILSPNPFSPPKSGMPLTYPSIICCESSSEVLKNTDTSGNAGTLRKCRAQSRRPLIRCCKRFRAYIEECIYPSYRRRGDGRERGYRELLQ